MEDLAELAASVTGLAARKHLTIVPAIPTNDCGPEVFLGPGELDLPGFLELAGRLSGGVLYLQAAPFDPGSGEDQPPGPPAHLLGHKGQTGQVSVAFAANGVVHFWEHETAWYLEWEELDGRAPRRFPGMDEGGETERLGQEERAQLAGELADAILADPQFRAARAVNRQRIARQAIPKGTEHWAAWDAIREAGDRANQMAQEQYDQLEDRLDGLAAELLASPAYQQASSAAARKQAAERFLILHADGFSPPTPVRDELYARARDLAKSAEASASSAWR
jgi:hypothetical protein